MNFLFTGGHRMKKSKKLAVRWLAGFLMPLLVSTLLIPALSCSRHDSHDPNVEYYTCSMHPSVKEKEPGSCPICGMPLIPIMKDTDLRDDSGIRSNAAGSGTAPGSFKIDPDRLQLIGVRFEKVEMRHIQRSLESTALLLPNPAQVYDINPRFSGWIEKIHVSYDGQNVRKGDPLFEIYSPDLVSATQDYLAAFSNHQRMKANTNSHADTIKTIKAVMNSAREGLLNMGLTESQVKELGTKQRGPNLVYRSPVTGIVTKVHAREGVHIKKGTMVYQIADIRNVWVEGIFYEDDRPFLSKGLRAEMRFKSIPDKVFQGSVFYVDPIASARNRTIRVRVALPNPELRLVPGLTGRIRVKRSVGKKISISKASVLYSGDKRYVFVYKDGGKIEVRFLQIGPEGDEFVEVRWGVKLGETVVRSAQFLIDSEARIRGLVGGSAPDGNSH